MLVRNYKKEPNAAEDKKEAERLARAEAAQYEQQYSHESSGSGGGGILESAIGSYIGTRGIRKELKQQNKNATPVKDYEFLTYCKLATISGIPYTTIKSIIYNQSKNPGITTIKKICDGLEISITDFFDTDTFRNLEQEIE